MTWNELLAAEPRLAALEKELREIKASDTLIYCSNEVFNGFGKWPGITPRLAALVGPQAETSALRAAEAYDLAYDYLSHILLPCRNCQSLCRTFE